MTLRRSARIQAADNATAIATALKRDTIVRQKSTKATTKPASQNGIQKKIRKPRTTKSTKTTNPPSTSKRSRKTQDANIATAIPITPTGNSITTALPEGENNNPSILDRPVEPHSTNALLKTPSSSQVLAFSGGDNEITVTAGTLLSKACAHLVHIEPKLQAVIGNNPCTVFSPEALAEEVEPFKSLVSSICAQQVSGAAANSIKNKFIALFDKSSNGAEDEKTLPFPTPQQVAETDITTLRTAGLSQRKAEYIKGLAEKFASRELTAKKLIEGSDEEIIELLTAVRGLGRWSVEMFMCFSLKRLDVFSCGDLGVQRGMAALLGKDVSKLKKAKGGKWKYMSEKDMLDYSAKFAPYRSVFMWYLWRIESVDVAVMSG
ncbi:MAG: 3-methyladenine DNA glycosylase [Cirrosporium novae-zelandiae]|nr:MAG: 3-methyladenine DNA glycosylase [Cirrosporium novae-zelandiae]